MEPVTINLEQATVRFGDKTALDNFTGEFTPGTVTALIGGDGAGKTTLLKLLAGRLRTHSGNNSGYAVDRHNVGYQPADSGVWRHLSVAENIAYVLHLKNYSKTDIEHIVTEKLQQVNLPPELANRFPHQLSGGQQQRVGIARALAANPNIILMDEPFGALDSITRQQLQRELKALHLLSGATIVFVTHDIAEALTLGTKVLVLDRGTIQQYDTPEMIKNHPANEFVQQLAN